MFDQTHGGTMRNLAIGRVLTAAIVGAGFALAFLKGKFFSAFAAQSRHFVPFWAISDQLA